MKHLPLFSIALVIAVTACPALAQDRAASAPMAASTPKDCGKATMKRHDHGAERGAGVSATRTGAAPCPGDAAASAPTKKAKRKPVHDHAKFNKNQ